MHDLTLEETPIVTAEQCAADTCIHIDTHSQDGNSVNSLDVCPTTETEQLKLRARQMETEQRANSWVTKNHHTVLMIRDKTYLL